ncbi:MAG: hypothetical protein Q9227_003978 [Pyrenula ochraceoflavens]
MKSMILPFLALEASLTYALPRSGSPDQAIVPRAALNFGKCSQPGIEFGFGFDGRTEASFQPINKGQFAHGSAQNIGVICSFICDRFRDTCGASTEAQSACTAAQAAASGKSGQEAADAWNSGLATQGNSTSAAASASSSVPELAATSVPFGNATTAVSSETRTGPKPTRTTASGSSGGNGGNSGSGGFGGKGGKGGKGESGAQPASSTTSGASATSTSAGSASSGNTGKGSGVGSGSGSGSTGNGGSGVGAGSTGATNSSGNPLLLLAQNVQNASQSDGQANAEAGQSPSATDPANFINFCTGQTLTNGQQVKSGSCNGIVMGQIPSTTNMISSLILSPLSGTQSGLKANTTFDIQVQVNNLEAGSFTNPDNTYYGGPQQLKGGKVVGHTHVTVQTLGASLKAVKAPDPTTFVFFKGINNVGNGNGGLNATVTGGLPSGNYRVCTMTSSSNHQPVLMPVAQRGAQDDCAKFTVS